MFSKNNVINHCLLSMYAESEHENVMMMYLCVNFGLNIKENRNT